MRSARALATVLLATWLPAAGANGQTPSPTGNLYGTVLDTQGNSMSGVRVTIIGPGAAQTSNTDAKGDFHFLNLSPSVYSVTLERTGFETARRDVTIALGNVVLSAILPLPGVAEAVTVSDGSPGLDTREIRTGATFGEKELQSIPTSRDPWAILRQVPGVLVDNMNVGGVSQGQPGIFGKGSKPDQASYNLDGVAISVGGISPLFFDFDSFSNVEVTTGGSDPAIATPGVTLNLVTKRGTNQLLGSARGFYTDDAGWDYGIEAGGPLWKDRLWLWGAFAHNDFPGGTGSNFVGEPLQEQQTLKHWNAKLNAQVIPANALTLSYTNLERVFLGFPFAPDRSQESTWNTVRPGHSYRIEDSHVFSANLFASVYFSDVSARPTSTPTGGVDEQAIMDEDLIWRHSFQLRRIVDDQRQSGLNASAFFDTGELRHETRFGFGYKHVRFESGLRWPSDQLVGYFIPFHHEADVTRPQNVKTELNVYGGFLADTIQAGNLTVNIGARFDYQQGRNLPSTVSANPVFPEILPAVQYGGDSGYPITWRQVQPRVGATYAIGRDRRTLLRASYSRFANQLDSTTIISVNAFPSIGELGWPWDDANGNGFVEPAEIDFSSDLIWWSGVNPDDPNSSTAVNQISKGFEVPTTDEFIVGVERQFSPDLSGSLAYTYRVARNLAFSPLIGTSRASYQYFGDAAGTVVSDVDGFVLNFSEPYYGLVECPDPCVGTILENRPNASETYSGVELQLIKSLSDGWMARVSFAWNDWQQRIGPGAIIDPNNVTPGTNATGPVVAGNVNATWQFNVSGMVQLPLGIAAGVNLFGRQGFPTPYFVEVFTEDLLFNVPQIQIGKATEDRTPNVYQLDLQLSRPFRIGSAVTVIPQFACFNLLDSRTVLQRDGFVGWYDVAVTPAFDDNDNFHAILETLSARTFRGGLRITF